MGGASSAVGQNSQKFVVCFLKNQESNKCFHHQDCCCWRPVGTSSEQSPPGSQKAQPLLCSYVFAHQRERDGSPIFWFTLPMPAVSRAGPGSSLELVLHLSPTSSLVLKTMKICLSFIEGLSVLQTTPAPRLYSRLVQALPGLSPLSNASGA